MDAADGDRGASALHRLRDGSCARVAAQQKKAAAGAAEWLLRGGWGASDSKHADAAKVRREKNRAFLATLDLVNC
jgi:hypothetical protein